MTNVPGCQRGLEGPWFKSPSLWYGRIFFVVRANATPSGHFSENTRKTINLAFSFDGLAKGLVCEMDVRRGLRALAPYVEWRERIVENVFKFEEQ